MSLTFEKLRQENGARSKECYPDSFENWTICDWMVALTGEVGEAANYIKKFKRGDKDWTEERMKEELRKELADIQMYLDHLARACDINLEEALIDKFDEVSERIGSSRTLRN